MISRTEPMAGAEFAPLPADAGEAQVLHRLEQGPDQLDLRESQDRTALQPCLERVFAAERE